LYGKGNYLDGLNGEDIQKLALQDKIPAKFEQEKKGFDQIKADAIKNVQAPIKNALSLAQEAKFAELKTKLQEIIDAENKEATSKSNAVKTKLGTNGDFGPIDFQQIEGIKATDEVVQILDSLNKRFDEVEGYVGSKNYKEAFASLENLSREVTDLDSTDENIKRLKKILGMSGWFSDSPMFGSQKLEINRVKNELNNKYIGLVV